MARTPFSPKRFEISNTIHREYRDFIYPYIYTGVTQGHITYEDDGSIPEEVKKYHDYQEARDCTLWIKHPNWTHAMKYTSQYRFRESDYQRFQDIVISTHNNVSGLPGELSKLLAVLFVYGYYTTATKNHLVEAIVTDCARMRDSILNGTIPYKTGHNRETDQTFITVKFKDLKAHDCVLLHWREDNGKRKRLRTTIDPPALKTLPYFGDSKETA